MRILSKASNDLLQMNYENYNRDFVSDVLTLLRQYGWLLPHTEIEKVFKHMYYNFAPTGAVNDKLRKYIGGHDLRDFMELALKMINSNRP